MNVTFREITETDYPQIKEIFAEGIATRNATFQTEPPEWVEWNKGKLPYCRLAAVMENKVAGWAALSATSSRYVYRGVNEVSIYISNKYQGIGIGKRLLKALISESEKSGVWTLTALIFPENKVSIKMHIDLGFREVGTMERKGQMDDGTWRDVVLLERRSSVTGL
jgi:L-amino acid N-acyltransferase YncA